jgi:hypothetical protein
MTIVYKIYSKFGEMCVIHSSVYGYTQAISIRTYDTLLSLYARRKGIKAVINEDGIFAESFTIPDPEMDFEPVNETAP